MTLDKVTSLADLEFKVKTNKYYKQLALLGAKRCCSNMTKLKALTTHEKVMEFLHRVSTDHNPGSCSAVVQEINHCCDKIKEEVETPLPVEATPTPSVTPASDKLKAVVAELKKKASSKQKRSVKAARGARSSTRSRTPTNSTRVRSTRHSNANGNHT